jgi:hypothetical protein
VPATQIVEIRAVDKVSAKLGIINKNLGRINKSVQGLNTGFGGLTGKIAAVGSAIGAAFGVKKILQTASQVEQLGVRFQFLFGSVEEGNKAFQEMLDYAGKVPFTLEQIQQGAGSLAVISDNAEELAKNMQIVGNVAAVSGLDFRTASEQIQRAFSGGAAAAEIFRERGILALLGFQAGAKVTADETAKRFEEVFGPGGRFENATLALANTYEGVLSMVQDKIFKFTLALGNQGGLLDFAKGILGTLDEILTEQFGSIEKFAEMAGQKIIEVVQGFALGLARMGDLLTPVFNLVATGINNLLNFVMALPPMIRDFGVIGFFLLGFKWKIITVLFAALFDEILWGIGWLAGKVQDLGNTLVSWWSGIKEFFGGDPVDFKFTFAGESPEKFSEGVKSKFNEITGSIEGSGNEMGRLEMLTTQFFEKVGLTIEQQKKLRKEIEDTVAASNVQLTDAQKLDNAMGDVVKKIQQQKDSIIGLTTDQKVALELEKLKVDELLAGVKVSEEARALKKQEIADLVRANILLKEREQIEQALGGIAGKTGGILKDFDPGKTALDKELEVLEDARRRGIIIDEQYYKARAKLQADYDRATADKRKREVSDTLDLIKSGTAKVEDIEALSGKQRVQLLGSIGKELLGTLGQTNEKAFKLAKAVAIAEAIVNVARGISAALALPFPFNIGAAALVAAQGAVQISAIKNQQYTGPREKGGPVGPNQTYLVGERGPEYLTMGANAGMITPMGGERDVNVTFNIQANDTRGFDDLITSRRGLIVNLINTAMNERGRAGVTT